MSERAGFGSGPAAIRPDRRFLSPGPDGSPPPERHLEVTIACRSAGGRFLASADSSTSGPARVLVQVGGEHLHPSSQRPASRGRPTERRSSPARPRDRPGGCVGSDAGRALGWHRVYVRSAAPGVAPRCRRSHHRRASSLLSPVRRATADRRWPARPGHAASADNFGEALAGRNGPVGERPDSIPPWRGGPTPVQGSRSPGW